MRSSRAAASATARPGNPATSSRATNTASPARCHSLLSMTRTASSSSTGAGRTPTSARGRNYYPKLVAAIPFTPATGQRLLLRDGPRDRSRDAAARRGTQHGRSRSARRRCTCCFRPSPSGRRSNERGSSRAKAVSSTGPTTATQNFDEFLGALQRRQAQESQTRAPTSGGGRHRVRAPARRRADRRRLGRDHRVLLANVLAPRPRAVLEPRFLRERGGDDAEQPA